MTNPGTPPHPSGLAAFARSHLRMTVYWERERALVGPTLAALFVKEAHGTRLEIRRLGGFAPGRNSEERGFAEGIPQAHVAPRAVARPGRRGCCRDGNSVRPGLGAERRVDAGIRFRLAH